MAEQVNNILEEKDTRRSRLRILKGYMSSEMLALTVSSISRDKISSIFNCRIAIPTLKMTSIPLK